MPAATTSNDCDLPQDRTDESLIGPHVLIEPEGLPATGVTSNSFHIYRAELSLYTREITDKVFRNGLWSWRMIKPQATVPDYEHTQRVDQAAKVRERAYEIRACLG